MILNIQSKRPCRTCQVGKVVVAGKAVILIEVGVVKRIRIITIRSVVQPAYAKKQLVAHKGCAYTGAITLATITSDTHFRKSSRLIPWLRSVDIYNSAHCISSIQRSLGATQYFDPFDVK